MNAKETRMVIGAEILEAMQKNEDLPLPNVHRLTKTMMEYFKQDGHADDLKELDYIWRPTKDYWRRHIREIASYLANKRKKHFCYYREWGSFKGMWQFCTKAEYKATLEREYSDVATRTGGYWRV